MYGRFFFFSFNSILLQLFASLLTFSSSYLLKLEVYDSVSWECTMEALKIKGFSDRWIAWMHTCICGGKSQVLLNGQLGRGIRCRKGLRQRLFVATFLHVGCWRSYFNGQHRGRGWTPSPGDFAVCRSYSASVMTSRRNWSSSGFCIVLSVG